MSGIALSNSKNNNNKTRFAKSGQKRRGIFHRTFLLSFLLSLIIITIFSVVTISRQRDAIIQSLESQAMSVSASIKQVCGNAIVSEEYDFIVEHNLEVIRNSPDILYILVVRHNGFSLVHTNGSWEYRDKSEPQWSSKTYDKTAQRILYSDLVQQDVLHHSLPLTYSGLNWGWLHVGLSLDHLNKEIFSMYKIMVILSLFCVGIGILGAYFFARQLTRPILSLVETTRLIGDGNLSTQTEITTKDEMAELGISFNNMAKKLQKTTVSKNYVTSIINNMNDALVVTAPDGTIQMINQAASDHLGYSKDELLGQPIGVIFKAKDVRQKGKWIDDLIQKGSIRNLEKACLSKEGKNIPVLVSGSVMRGEQGKLQGIICVVIDISDRKRAEEALRESKEKYRRLYAESKRAEEVYHSLLNSSADAIVTYDLEGRAEFISPAFTKIFGWTLEEVKGKRIPFLPDSERESAMAIIKDLVKNGKPCHGFETKRYTKDRRILDVSISASCYDDHVGKPAGTLVSLRDISEKKKLETQLKHADRMEAIGTLAGGVAHDFNNLMMGIQGNISLMLYDTVSTHPHYEKLKNIEKMIKSGSTLTSQLLGYARKGKYEVKLINLNQIVKESSGTFGRTRKEITIHKELAENLFAIRADETQIEQVLMNLYINAADAMPGSGNLFLKTMNTTHEEMKDKPYDPIPGKYVLLKVIDKGTGMDEETVGRIFEPFFTTKEMSRGTGLGLASVYGIVKGHGGFIDVDSKKGQGTSFSIYLPASDKLIPKALDVSDQIIRGSETILLVDDEEIVLDVGVQMLKKLGYTVLEAKSGKEANDVYKEKIDKIDLVLLDMIMPDMSGGETYDKLKEINPEVKVLLSSGYSINGQATEIMNRGCDGFIQKPFNMEKLSKKIKEILNKEKYLVPPSAEVENPISCDVT